MVSGSEAMQAVRSEPVLVRVAVVPLAAELEPAAELDAAELEAVLLVVPLEPQAARPSSRQAASKTVMIFFIAFLPN